MHEFAIAHDIYTTARRAALENKANLVKRIHVDVGEMALVNPEQVEFLFQAISEDDPLFSGATLVCRPVKPRTKCGCGYEGDEIFICPTCGALPEVEQGREIVVTSLEIDVDGA
ncbi:MAG TPA: hydrogenase maturation nickel metallochaperone HypA [Methanomicrobiales archaeon]|jgi:hydrogenase nickel incorporation protein HypA/HybF|nr:hydrogenase maturation nickel metallochaperone HypA [Methanomicrobiales archaeon]